MSALGIAAITYAHHFAVATAAKRLIRRTTSAAQPMLGENSGDK